MTYKLCRGLRHVANDCIENIMQKTRLIVLRGPSGSGKSSVAKTVREEYLAHGYKMAYVEQDHFRRVILKEGDVPNGFNISLIKEMTIFLLHNGYDVIMEGIFDKGRYEKMFSELILFHPANNYFFYFDISLEETVKRHDTKPNKNEFGEKELRAWYKKKDFLECVVEEIISERNDVSETIKIIKKVSEFEMRT
jgi:thymidylate kinase